MENMSEPGEGLADLSDPEVTESPSEDDNTPVPRKRRWDVARRLRGTSREAWCPGISSTDEVPYQDGEKTCQACLLAYEEPDLHVGKCGSRRLCEACLFAMSL